MRVHLVQVDGGTAVVGDVGMHMEVAHAHLPEVAGVVLVKVDPREKFNMQAYHLKRVEKMATCFRPAYKVFKRIRTTPF